LYKIEEAFDIQIPDQDLASMATVASVAQYVNRRLTPTTPPAATHARPTAKGKKKR
jgi:acyl carrier protein